MANVFKSDLDILARAYLRDRVNSMAVWSNSSYPGGFPGQYLTPFSTDPIQARPSIYGVSASNRSPTAESIRADVIALAQVYNNIIRVSYSGGAGYAAVQDELPTSSYRPDSNPYIVVGTDGIGYGMSNGGGTDDGLAGTNHAYGGYSQNSWSGSILQDYAITHAYVGGNRWFCLRYKPGGYAGKYCMVYDDQFQVFGYGQLFFRQEMGYALAGLSRGFDSYVGRRVYIYISDGPPPTPTDNVKIAAHKNALTSALNNGVGHISGNITQYSVAVLYDQAWNIIYNLANADSFAFPN